MRFMDRGRDEQVRESPRDVAWPTAGQARSSGKPPSADRHAVMESRSRFERRSRRGSRIHSFHPTSCVDGAPRFLISEAVRGEGARLLNTHGEPFMPRYDRAGDLAARDIVARSIVRESHRTGGPVYLSLAHLDSAFVHERFPGIAAICRQVGLDFARDRIPVGPAAHYVMGGVETDLDGRTSLPGLFAAGEVACTRVHGANRLASNSLLEGLVFGARAGRAMRQPLVACSLPSPEFRSLAVEGERRPPASPLAEDSIRD